MNKQLDSLASYFTELDETGSLNEKLVRRILQDIHTKNPMSILILQGARQVLEREEVFHPMYEDAKDKIHSLLPMMRDTQNALIPHLMEKGHDVGVDKEGNIVLILEGVSVPV